MRRLVARYKASGQSMAAFCKSTGTVGHILRYWVGRFALGSEGVCRSDFREIKVVSAPLPASATSTKSKGIMMKTPSGITLCFPADYSAAALADIISRLSC